jgi:hypothetical protein
MLINNNFLTFCSKVKKANNDVDIDQMTANSTDFLSFFSFSMILPIKHISLKHYQITKSIKSKYLYKIFCFFIRNLIGRYNSVENLNNKIQYNHY